MGYLYHRKQPTAAQAPPPPTREPVVKLWPAHPCRSPTPARDGGGRALQSGGALALKGKTVTGDSKVQLSLGTVILWKGSSRQPPRESAEWAALPEAGALSGQGVLVSLGVK